MTCPATTPVRFAKATDGYAVTRTADGAELGTVRRDATGRDLWHAYSTAGALIGAEFPTRAKAAAYLVEQRHRADNPTTPPAVPADVATREARMVSGEETTAEAAARRDAERAEVAAAIAAALADDVPVDPMTAPCFACNAEPGERCRPGCTGEAVIADALAEAEDLDRCATGCTCTDAERRTTGEAGPTRRERRAVARMPRRATGRRMSRADLVAAMRARIATA